MAVCLHNSLSYLFNIHGRTVVRVFGCVSEKKWADNANVKRVVFRCCCVLLDPGLIRFGEIHSLFDT